MAFHSARFLCFFPLVCLAYFLLPKRWRWIWLLAASYYFYMGWNARYALLMLASTVITYGSGLGIGGTSSRRARRIWLAASLAGNLAILAAFKYSGFLIDNVNALANRLGCGWEMRRFDVLLPVGISFYTFQALSYTMDVYRGQLQPERNFLRYALYVSFFPQLVAGPIERSTNLLPQIREPHSFDWDRVRRGLQLMLWGYFEKLVIADRVAVVVDRVYGSYADFSGAWIVAATLLFALQIYCDFGGYSHIAIGAAEVLGIRLMDNFRQPYFATSVRDFWRRWHISLSTWFRDYVYIPLGGNRKGRLRQNLNLMATFLLSGLWHGAAWHYLAWGGINGAFQVAGGWKDRLLARFPRVDRIRNLPALRPVRIACTALLICFAWLFFRAEGVGRALAMMRWSVRTFTAPPQAADIGLTAAQCAVLACAVAVLLMVDVAHERGASIRGWLSRSEPRRALGALLMVAGVFAVLLCGAYGVGYDASAFIYFQF